jgi:hypothetical protein
MMDLTNFGETQTKWIERLALEELNMEDTNIVHMHDHIDPHFYLEQSSIELVNKLKNRFEFYINKFNEYRGNQIGGNPIKLFKISNTVNDFMLFRNSLRLIVARKANDLISVGFLSNKGKIFSPGEDHKDYNRDIHSLKAHIGAFNKITWRVGGDIVDEEALVNYFLSEFIRNSSR